MRGHYLSAETVKRHPPVAKARLEVTRAGEADVMTLRCGTAAPTPGLTEALARDLQAVCKLRGEVALAGPGTLPNDGKIIDDLRTYE